MIFLVAAALTVPFECLQVHQLHQLVGVLDASDQCPSDSLLLLATVTAQLLQSAYQDVCSFAFVENLALSSEEVMEYMYPLALQPSKLLDCACLGRAGAAFLADRVELVWCRR